MGRLYGISIREFRHLVYSAGIAKVTVTCKQVIVTSGPLKTGSAVVASAKTSARFPFPKPTISNGGRLRQVSLKSKGWPDSGEEGIRRKLRELVPKYQLSTKVISFRVASWTDGGKRVA